jgi:hypothetical protein
MLLTRPRGRRQLFQRAKLYQKSGDFLRGLSDCGGAKPSSPNATAPKSMVLSRGSFARRSAPPLERLVSSLNCQALEGLLTRTAAQRGGGDGDGKTKKK